MDLVVISSPQTKDTEVAEVVKMFEMGLSHFHVRKPKASKQELKHYLELFPKKYRKRMVLHSYHHLASVLSLGGIHLSRHHRKRGRFYQIKLWLKRKSDPTLIVSRTFHKLTDITSDRRAYSYAFLSPVFDSVSQSSLSAGFSKRALLNIIPQSLQPIYALGGITSERLQAVSDSGFHGAVFHGSLWNGSKTASTTFAEALKTVHDIAERSKLQSEAN